jgi:EAL domain-containing protein (putative c-di-GMP-specific phosphodiesterase class I)
MLNSSTTRATPRMFLRAASPRSYGGPLDDGFCSPAGLHRRPWLERLRRAIAEDLFVLHFQPIVSLQDGGVSHYEALLRLADEPDGRLIAPGEFLPAAERYGLIRQIDRMVFDKAVALLGGGFGHNGIRLAINISAVSVTDGTLLAYIERGLSEHEVDHSLLVVEITETAAISDIQSARTFCLGVLALGCQVALDDFGAGFGSFQYLKHLPFSYLKIDGDFIRGLPSSHTDQLVVKALAGVVSGMGRETIAEFVGDEATLSMLRCYGVDYAQGYEVGRPRATVAMPA